VLTGGCHLAVKAENLRPRQATTQLQDDTKAEPFRHKLMNARFEQLQGSSPEEA